MAPNSKFVEIEAFLNDALVYFTSDVQSVDYQNTCNDFEPGGSRRKPPEEMMSRCQELLKWIETYSLEERFRSTSSANDGNASNQDDGYLDMSSSNRKCPQNSNSEFPNDYVLISPLSADSDEKSLKDVSIAAPSTLCEFPKSNDEAAEVQNSPYAGLPAAHLTIKKSPKQGQLTRIEKRIFFDQSKKYFCGVVADWLLCYADGPTSIKPTLCVPLSSGTEVEGYGEGKRRDLCFQISTSSGKRYIFQSNSEIDAKAWIHAIEGTVRGIYRSSPARDHETGANRLSIKNQSPINNNLRKLPTPPAMKRNYSNIHQSAGTSTDDRRGEGDRSSDEIYEEPCPLYKADRSASSASTPISGTSAIRASPAKYEEYDVPKSLNANAPIEATTTTTTVSPIAVEPKVSEIVAVKVHEVQSKLSPQTQPLGGVSTTLETDGDRSIEKGITQKADSPVEKSNVDHPGQNVSISQNSTPVRNWFKTRLNKGGGSGGALSSGGNSNQQQHKATSKNRLRPKNLKENFNSVHSSETCNIGGGGAQTRILVASAKGEKVNMIVNKLVDANGRMPIFRGGGNGGKTHVFNSPDCAVELAARFACDDSNYELINTFTKA